MALLDHIRFRLHMLWLAFTLKPIRGADDGDDADKDADADADKDDDAKDADKSDEGDKDDDAEKDDADKDDKAEKDDDGRTQWERHARRHERAAKTARKKVQDLEAKLKARDDENKSEQEKAIEKARGEATTKAESAFQKERRADKLESAVTRLAAKGIKVGDGDDAETVKFADPEDVLLYVQKAIDSEDIDADDIFEEGGKVKQDALTSELVELARLKPHWKLSEEKGKAKAAGDGDAGKGKGAKTELEEMSVADHVKRLDTRNR